MSVSAGGKTNDESASLVMRLLREPRQGGGPQAPGNGIVGRFRNLSSVACLQKKTDAHCSAVSALIFTKTTGYFTGLKP